MNSFSTFFFLGIIVQILIGINACERSLEIRGVEDVCWTKNVEVIERIHYTGKSVLNFAKKKLGIDVEQGEEPQKCDYYTCIFEELKLLNGNDYPCYDKITTWVKNNVIYNHALLLLSQVEKCSTGLSNSTISGTYFVGDKVGKDIVEENDSESEPQNKCDIAAEYMKCMAIVEKDEKCPVFQYP